ncbi:MAG TPA: hypothetical protein VI072_02685 [Polyangiaceae bacterium]
MKVSLNRAGLRLGMLLVGGLVLTSQGCGSDCTDAGYTPGTEIVFSRALSDSETFQVEVTADGQTETCQVGEGLTTCVSLVEPLWASTKPTVTSGGAQVPIGGFAGVHVFGRAWARVKISLRQDDQLVAEREYSDLSYKSFELNGDGCGETALSTQTLDVP